MASPSYPVKVPLRVDVLLGMLVSSQALGKQKFCIKPGGGVVIFKIQGAFAVPSLRQPL